MSRYNSSAEALEDRIEALIRYAEKLRLEKKELEERNDEMARRLKDREGRIEELERQVEEMGLGGGSSPSQRKEMEKRIDGMIRELDHCIALLES